MDDTIIYYEQNAGRFIENTIHSDMHESQDRFLRKLPGDGRILDYGCGSGRDTAYFLKNGYQVDAMDGSLELCRFATDFTGVPVKHMLFQELDAEDIYHGVWACASILHVERAELPDIFDKVHRALKDGGVFYCSFKYGNREEFRNGRFFNDMNEHSLRDLMDVVQGFELESSWISVDVRADRQDEHWLNIILKKL